MCEVLSNYPIDPHVNDHWSKIAHDYCCAKGDKFVPFFKKIVQLMEKRMLNHLL